ncbi:MAG: hypothetical protein JXQ29_15575 [Planctomycetes bacterium]|nr:hypothetical protein [Planctomycetota bacterium]
MRNPIGIRRLTFVLLAGALGATCDGVHDTAGRTPEDTFRLFLTAAQRGDVETYCRLQGAMGAAQLRHERATQALHMAVAARFGVPPRARPSLLADLIKQEYHPSCEVKAKVRLGKDRMLLTVWSSRHGSICEEPWLAFIEDGEWRIMPAGKGMVRQEMRKGPDGAQIAVSVVDYPADRFAMERSLSTEWDDARASDLEKLTKEVSAGHFSSREEVENRNYDLLRALEERQSYP